MLTNRELFLALNEKTPSRARTGVRVHVYTEGSFLYTARDLALLTVRIYSIMLQIIGNRIVIDGCLDHEGKVIPYYWLLT